MNALERALVKATQAGLPLVPRPYEVLSKDLGINEAQLISLLQKMLADGRIRRIGAVPNHYALGYTANAMSVWDVADEAVDELGHAVGALPFVTHCYRRVRRLPDWPYNLFAMVHGRSRAETAAKIEVIRGTLDRFLRAADVLYSMRVLKKTGVRIA
ncbi:MAG TPA: Lrp/AsnC family transcriptional regulator [Burkholderiales bacterium]|nr:Lrp/AsnC family transcriptional regulator [Burkholderiales bacterium]